MYAAVDIGGTKTLVAVFTPDGKLNEQIKFATPAKYDDFLKQMADVVANLSTKEFIAVGAAAPGKIDHQTGTLIAAGNLAWKNASIKSDLNTIFNTPVHIENDAKAAALAESRALNGEFSKVVYITISTGIGVGVCVNGEIDNTLRDSEPGRMDIEYQGEMVPWESIASGSSLVKRYGKRASEIEDPAIWRELSHNLAKGLVTIIAMVQPDIILVGGGAGNYLEKFYEPLLEELKKYENPLAPTPPIRKALHPEEAVVYGCYELAKDAQ